MTATSKTLDFTNVKEGGTFNKKRIPAGDYLATITKVEDAVAKDDVFQYLFTIKIDKHPTSLLPYYCKLQENQLWKLRNILVAGGIAVPKKRQKVEPGRLVGKKIGVTVDDAEYEGKEQSEIGGVFPAADLVDSGPDDEEEFEESEEETEEEEAEDDLSEDEPEEEIEEEEEAPEGDEWDEITDRLELRKALKRVAPDVKTSSSQTEDDIRDLIRAAIASSTEEEPEEEEEEEAPAPVKKAVAKKTVAVKKKIDEVSDDELEELDIDDL